MYTQAYSFFSFFLFLAYLFHSIKIFLNTGYTSDIVEYMFMTCRLFLPAPFIKSDGGNPAFSYFTTLLTVCAIPAMIWLDWCQFGKFWVETCSLLFMKAWIPLCCTHTYLSSMGRRIFCDWLKKNHSFERWYHWWIKYWKSEEKIRDLGKRWVLISVGDF